MACAPKSACLWCSSSGRCTDSLSSECYHHSLSAKLVSKLSYNLWRSKVCLLKNLVQFLRPFSKMLAFSLQICLSQWGKGFMCVPSPSLWPRSVSCELTALYLWSECVSWALRTCVKRMWGFGVPIYRFLLPMGCLHLFLLLVTVLLACTILYRLSSLDLSADTWKSCIWLKWHVGLRLFW